MLKLALWFNEAQIASAKLLFGNRIDVYMLAIQSVSFAIEHTQLRCKRVARMKEKF